MKSLIWKEWHENFKWTALPGLLLLGPMILFGVPLLVDANYLGYVSLVAGISGAALGFLQVCAEARGDKRALLLHRPLSPSWIFVGKVIAGVSLYLLALLAPSALAVILAATPGHVAAPFEWGMVLPWLADVLTGLVYYFAGMLIAQRDARWYGSRCLPLAAGLCASLLVWNVSEFWQALTVIAGFGGILAVAAWGSILSGGAYDSQPRIARVALGVTLLSGLSVLVFAGKVTLGLCVAEPFDFPYDIDHQGHLFLIHQTGAKITSITDRDGHVSDSLKGSRLDQYTVNNMRVMSVNAEPQPRGCSYRNPGRYLLVYKNETTPPHEAWWYVPRLGRILGYDKGLKFFLGSFGPDGFVPPDGQPGAQFHGQVCQKSLGYEALARDPLAFPTGVYSVDFHKGVVRTLFVPPAGQRVRWAGKQTEKAERWSICAVGTDKAIHYLDQGGKKLLTVPLAYGVATDEVDIVGRLVKPERYWAWYIPQWHQPVHLQASEPETKIVVYDAAGHEYEPRQESRPRPGVTRITPVNYSDMLVEPSSMQALSGLATSPVEVGALVGTTSYLEAEARRDPLEAPLLLQNLWFTTQAYIPGVRWDVQAHRGLAFNFAALIALASVCSALACFMLPRRYAFSRRRRLGWAVCGLLFGPTGLLLMIAMLEWPARIRCAQCQKLRVVIRENCEHCGAAQATPARDGTEIMESKAATVCGVLVHG